MTEERKIAIVEDINEAETAEELEALVENMEETEPAALKDMVVLGAVADKRDQFAATAEPEPVSEVAVEEMSREDLLARIAELEARSKERTSVVGPKPKVERPKREVTYRLLSEDVGWSTVPQVHAVMMILRMALGLKVGDAFTNSAAVEAMELNREVLGTRQPGRKIWDYYKGRSNEGLMTHGTIEKL